LKFERRKFTWFFGEKWDLNEGIFIQMKNVLTLVKSNINGRHGIRANYYFFLIFS